MNRIFAVAAFVFLAAGEHRTETDADEITVETVRAVDAWVRAVVVHVPGRRDVSVATVSTLTFDQRTQLNAGMELFLSHLLGKTGPVKTEPEKQIAEIARTLRVSPGPQSFLKRAAVLHSDCGVVIYVHGLSAPAPARAHAPGARVPPLLSDRPLFLGKDGEIVGEATASWNWSFARSLLDLANRPEDLPFVREWYHATAAVMLRNGWYADVSGHLQHAATVFTDDATILFDRATFAEIQGLPVNQVLLSDNDLIALRAQRFERRPLGGAGTQRFVALGIPPPEVANDEAERLFRRTLAVDPSLVEARVRLARLLYERKRHEEAARELDMALAAKPAGVVAFYARLFSGRAAQALGRLEDASRHYREAAALFPGAQSARLAQSQAALHAADVSGALEPIHEMEKPAGAQPPHDPWWQYELGTGRDADALLRAMWARLSSGSGL